MANQFGLITKYLNNVVDTVMIEESKTAVLENGAKFIDVSFKEAGYVKVMSLLMDGLSDYYRVNGGDVGQDYVHYQNGSADGYKKGNAEGSWELFQLQYDRGKQFQIDNMDDEETAGLVIGNLLTEFLRTKVVPEIDAVRFSKMAAKCSVSLGNLVAETINANEIIEKFNTASEWLSEHEVPAEDQIIFVNPAIYTMIKSTTELEHRLSQVDFKSGDGVTFKLQAYEGKPIIVVPTNRFFTNVICGANGYYAGTGSKVINFMVVSKKAIVPVVKLNKSNIWTPDQVQDFDGFKINFRLYHDVIIPKNKIAGVYVSLSATDASTKSNKLSVDLAVDTGAKDLVMNEYYTNPAGIYGAKCIYSTTALAVGTTYTAGATNQVITKDVPFDKIGSETKAHFALVDANNLVLAASGEVTLPTE